MGNYSFNDEQDADTGGMTITTNYLSIFVRIVGIILLLVGFWIGIKVIVEAWALYRGPHHVERFAKAIERGSNLDKALAPFTSSSASEAGSGGGSPDADGFRLTYFLAWIIVLLLLMVIGRLSLGAIKTGGELALYDLQVKRFARLLLSEMKRDEQTVKRLRSGR